MAPSRGEPDASTALLAPAAAATATHPSPSSHPVQDRDVSGPAEEPANFSVRALLVGAAVGTVICFSNMYFGLQTGWISPMTMPASLLGFGIFRLLEAQGVLGSPRFSPVENVLVQTVAGSMAIMPLGCGFVGVIPAMSHLLKPRESGPVVFDLPQSLIWSIGLCYFGVLFAVPLRKQVLIREKLRFPSGFSTAVLIGVLHGRAPHARHHSGGQVHGHDQDDDAAHRFGAMAGDTLPASGSAVDMEAVPGNPFMGLDTQEVVGDGDGDDDGEGSYLEGTTSASSSTTTASAISEAFERESHPSPQLSSSISILLASFVFSGLFNLLAYFLPVLRAVPVFGTYAASSWLWDLNPSPAYVGQGIIMGPETTLHMLLGAAVGWGILSPLAKMRGWAPGEVKDWENGSKGWIVWVSLAIMLADSVVSLGFIAVAPAVRPVGRWVNGLVRWVDEKRKTLNEGGYMPLPALNEHHDDGDGLESDGHATPLARSGSGCHSRTRIGRRASNASKFHLHNDDAPSHQHVPSTVIHVGLLLSVLLCVACISYVFGPLVPLHATILSVLMALLLSVMGVRALGQTDLNPVSGISKLAQLFFALIIPQSDPRSVLINLVAGAVSEAGALQSGDLMQDLKTGHLLAASPAAQFWGQVFGSTVGAVVSALVYRLYSSVYTLPSKLFQIPTAYVWIFTARLVTGRGLPPMATEWAIGSGALFVIFTAARTAAAMSAGAAGSEAAEKRKRMSWTKWVPGGIAVAVGMYNVPSFTLARALGGVINWWWIRRRGGQMTPLIILASGFILGEGFLSIVNLILQSAGVPHL